MAHSQGGYLPSRKILHGGELRQGPTTYSKLHKVGNRIKAK